MAMTLTAGREMRLDGAPDLLLPNEAEIIDSLAADLLANDTDGLYNGDRNLARLAAERRYREMVQQQQAQRAASEATAAKRNADRNAQRAAVRGVEPESLPADEYGGVSRQTVREANRPRQDAEAALMQDQDLADQITGGLRTGNLNWQAEADRQYSQEHGLGGFEYGPGQTDLDIRRRIQDQQGFIRTQQGMIPAGRSPTPEQIENYRDFHFDWANETPGSERQARYNPEAHAEWQEARAQEIQDRARTDVQKYGTGTSDPILRQQLKLPPLSHQQTAQRLMRQRSEDRQLGRPVTGFDGTPARGDDGKLLPMAASGRRELIARARRQAQRAGQSPDDVVAYANGQLAAADQEPLTQEEIMLLGGTLARDAERDVRKARVAEQAMLAGGQPTGGPFGTRATVNAINELPDEWRNIAILDRITQGRVGGPTPIERDALTLKNMQRLMNSDIMAGNDPFRQQMMRDQQQLRESQLPAKEQLALSRARGEPIGTGLSAGAVQSAWNSRWSEAGFIEQMEAAGYQLPEIQAWIDRKRNGGAPGPRAVAPPPPGEGGPSTLDFGPSAGDMSF